MERPSDDVSPYHARVTKTPISSAFLAVAFCAALLAAQPAAGHGSLAGRLARADQRIERDPGNPDPYLARSVLHRDHDDYERALADLDLAARLDPERILVERLRGELYLAWGRPADAVAPLERFLSREPDHAEAHLALARAFAALDRPLESAHHFERAIENAPVPIPAHYLERARAFAAAGPDYVDQALRSLDAGVERLGPIPALTGYAIELEARRGRYDAALARLDLVPRSEHGASWLARRAALLEQAGRSAEARATYAELLGRLVQLPARRRGTPASLALHSHARDELARLSLAAE